MKFLCCCLLMAVGVGEAEDLQKFQIWRTVGESSGCAWGATLLEVQKAGSGSLVRFVYVGLGDSCGRTTLMAWHKQVDGKSPADVAKPADLCAVTQAQLNNMVRRDQVAFPYEADIESLTIRCGEREQILHVPAINADPDSPFVSLHSRVLSSVWRAPPIWSEVDRDAEREGAEYAKGAGDLNTDRDWAIQTFGRFLRQYRGPIGTATQEWEIDPPGGVRLIRFGGLPLFKQSGDKKSYSVRLRLDVDRRSGEVLSSTSLDEVSADLTVAEVWHASLYWVFEPGTLPAEAPITVTVRHTANCGAHYRR